MPKSVCFYQELAVSIGILLESKNKQKALRVN